MKISNNIKYCFCWFLFIPIFVLTFHSTELLYNKIRKDSKLVSTFTQQSYRYYIPKNSKEVDFVKNIQSQSSITIESFKKNAHTYPYKIYTMTFRDDLKAFKMEYYGTKDCNFNHLIYAQQIISILDVPEAEYTHYKYINWELNRNKKGEIIVTYEKTINGGIAFLLILCLAVIGIVFNYIFCGWLYLKIRNKNENL